MKFKLRHYACGASSDLQQELQISHSLCSEANELYGNQAPRCLRRHENEQQSIHSLCSEANSLVLW